MTRVHCGVDIISGGWGDATAVARATAPAISRHDYQSLALQSTFADVTQLFGAPLSRADLKQFLSVSSLAPLIQSQPLGESCAYYLDGANRAGRAFQLCFGKSLALTEKAILTTSAGSAS